MAQKLRSDDDTKLTVVLTACMCTFRPSGSVVSSVRSQSGTRYVVTAAHARLGFGANSKSGAGKRGEFRADGLLTGC